MRGGSGQETGPGPSRRHAACGVRYNGLVRAPSLHAVVVAAVASVPACAPPPATAPGVGAVTVDCGGEVVVAEVAADPAARARGLALRREVPEGTGMLFAYPADAHVALGMKDTYVALSVAFLDASGAVVGVADLEPFDPAPRASPGPVRYALEVPWGWLRARGIGVGDRCEVRLPAGLRPV